MAGLTIYWAFKAARYFAGNLGGAMLLLAAGMGGMVLNFLLGLSNHLSLAGITDNPLAHSGALHGTTIVIALAMISGGFMLIHRAAVEVAKERAQS